MTERKCPEMSTITAVQQTGVNAEPFVEVGGTDLISLKGRGRSVLCVVNHVLGALSSIASVEGAGVLQLALLGSGWSVKEKSLQVSKLHGCVKRMALVEEPGKSNTNLQCANPTYRPFPDARPTLN